MIPKQQSIYIFVIIFLIFNITSPVFAERPDDVDSLKGITKGKVIWDVTISDPSRLLFVMKVIATTYDDLVEQNVQPDMVFTFHGRVLKLLSTDSIELSLDDEVAHEELLELIHDLSERPGVKMESCSVAAQFLGIDNSTIISEIKPVGNTFVSLIGYQQKGYALIPVN